MKSRERRTRTAASADPPDYGTSDPLNLNNTKAAPSGRHKRRKGGPVPIV